MDEPREHHCYSGGQDGAGYAAYFHALCLAHDRKATQANGGQLNLFPRQGRETDLIQNVDIACNNKQAIVFVVLLTERKGKLFGDFFIAHDFYSDIGA